MSGSNIYITSIGQPTAAGVYELTQGPVVKRLDRYQRANDPDLGEAWRGLCAVRVGLRTGCFVGVEHHALARNRDAYVIEVNDSRGQPIRGTIFTEKTGDASPSPAIRSVQVSCRGDRLHFNSSLPGDLHVVETAFQQAIDVFVRQGRA